MSYGEIEFDVLGDAAEVPGRVILVTRRMIAIVSVILGLGGATLTTADHAVLTAFRIQRRYALAGEVQVIRAVIVTAFRGRLGIDVTAFLQGNRFAQIIFQFATAITHDDHIPHGIVGAQRIHIDICHRGCDGKQGVLAVPL